MQDEFDELNVFGDTDEDCCRDMDECEASDHCPCFYGEEGVCCNCEEVNNGL